MASSICMESLLGCTKRLKISRPRIPTPTTHRRAAQTQASSSSESRSVIAPAATEQQKSQPENELRSLRLPKAVQAVFLAPLKRTPTHGIPVCDLQVRSYSVRNLEAFTDFCMRAAYYLNLPAKGPVPLPRITERWTVPRSNFIHKKSQENFERKTLRRLIQIQDGHPDTVATWLAYIQKQRYYGVGIKANVFEHSELDVLPSMDRDDQIQTEVLSASRRKRHGSAERYINTFINEPFKAQWGAWAGMSGLDNAPAGRKRFQRQALPK